MSGDNSGRYEVVVGRRVFSAEQKGAIVAEASGVGVNVSEVARRHNIKPSLLFRWRRQVEVLTEPAKHHSPQFLPVTVAAPTATPTPSAKAGMIEIELAFGRKLRVAFDIDLAALKRIIVALETA